MQSRPECDARPLQNQNQKYIYVYDLSPAECSHVVI